MIKKIFIVISFCLMNQPLLAKERVVLLSAIYDYIKIDPLIYSKLDTILRQSLSETDFEIKVVNHATQKDLNTYLNDSKTNALFWISHAGNQKPKTKGISFGNLILDSNKINVLPLFQKINTNIKWIGIIGCNTKQLIQKLENKNFFLPDYFVTDGQITPQQGLKKAIHDFKKTNQENNFCKKMFKTGLTIEVIKETETTKINTVQIFHGTQFLGLHSGNNQNEKSKKFFLELDQIEDLTKNLFVVSSGKIKSEYLKVSLGRYRFFSQGVELPISPAMINGRIIGGTENPYIFKKEFDWTNLSLEEKEIWCAE